MAIPDKPLELDIESVKINLGDMEIFDTELAESEPLVWISSVRRFLIRHSAWTRAEIRAINIDELADLGPQLAEATRRQSVPLANSPSSKTGRAKRATPGHQDGLPNSNSAKISASRPTKSEAG